MSSAQADVATATATIQFFDKEALPTGPTLNVPRGITVQQLDLLINQLLSNDEPVPYAFAVDGKEISTSLSQDILGQGQANCEQIIQVTYFPQALFRVQPATRCSSSLEGHTKEILSVAFSPNGAVLATGSGDCTVRLWDLATETPIASGAVHKNWVLCIAWSPNAKLLASGGMDNLVVLWDGPTGAALGKPLAGHTQFISALAWEPMKSHESSPSRLASASKDGTVRVWDVVQKCCLFSLSSHTSAVTCLRWSAFGGRIYTGSRDRTLKVWAVGGAEAQHGILERTLEGHAHWINTMALSTDYASRCALFDWEGKAVATTACKLPSSERIITGSDDFTMFLWDPASGSNKPIARMTGHQALVTQVIFSPDARWIASCSFDKSVKLWNASTGAFVASFRGHVGPVYQISFSADSRFLVSASKDATVKIWSVREKQLHSELAGHRDEVYAIDWAPTGQYVASGGKDRVLKIWRQ
jgi:ribosome assembly protein 4